MSDKKHNRIKLAIAPRFYWVVSVAINILLALALVTCLILYNLQNENEAKVQNINNITSISRSKSIQAKTLLNAYSLSLKNIYNFCNGKTLDEALGYITHVYGDDTEFQLVRLYERGPTYTIYTGFSTLAAEDGGYTPLKYQSGAHADLLYMFDNYAEKGVTKYTNTFTNQTNGIKSFSPYCGISLTEDGEAYDYVLLNPHTGSSLIESMDVSSQYSATVTAIFDNDGAYLAYEPGYKSLNFYNYIYTFNKLTLDQMNAVRDSVRGDEDGSGVLNFKDSKERDCTFVYSKFHATSDWYVIVCVLNSDFLSGNTIGAYPLMIMIILVALLLYDTLQLWRTIRRLRISVANEKTANLAKSDFLARMSHDIRTPMNGITGLTDLTLEIRGLPNEAEQNLRQISDLNKYLTNLINDILDMNVISSGKMELHEEAENVEDLVAAVVALSKASIADKRLSFTLKKELEFSETVMVDKVRVKQVLMNILSNSVKYTNVGGRIDFTCRCDKKEDGRLYYAFIIKDNGLGMSEEFVRKIFEPFSREYNSMTTKYAGTGLGMSIVKTLVDLMNGTISITSEKDVGTEVDIRLDFEIADSVVIENSHAEQDFEILKGKRMLLVDDNPINIAIANKMLTVSGVIVDIAEDGKQALDKFIASGEGDYSAILMDVKMPVMDGIEATKAIRTLRRADAETVPIIAMTANAFAEDVNDTKTAGMNAHLTKPINKDVLLCELARQLKGAAKFETY